MLRVLFVTEKWPAHNPDFGLTNSYHNLFGAFNSTGLGSFTVIHPDAYFLEQDEPIDRFLVHYALKHQPDIIVYTWVTGKSYGPDFRLGHFNPRIRTWDLLKGVSPKTKLVAVWWDFVWPVSQEVASFLEMFDLHIPIDISFDEAPTSVMSLWTPQDPILYHAPVSGNREIPVLLPGRNRPERGQLVELLERVGISIKQAGGQKDDRFSPEDYAQLFQQSKIVVDLTPVLHKGRAWETTLSGALLLAADSSQINRWFIPDFEYVTYRVQQKDGKAVVDVRDMADKIRYYLEHDAERCEIAQRGYEKAQTEYSATKWWQRILTRLGIHNESGNGETA